MWVRHYRRDWLGPDLIAGVLVLRPRGRLHFANVRHMNQRIVAAIEASGPPPRVVIRDVVAVPDLEITAVAALHDLVEDLRARGTELWVASLTRAARASAYAGRP